MWILVALASGTSLRSDWILNIPYWILDIPSSTFLNSSKNLVGQTDYALKIY